MSRKLKFLHTECFSWYIRLVSSIFSLSSQAVIATILEQAFCRFLYLWWLLIFQSKKKPGITQRKQEFQSSTAGTGLWTITFNTDYWKINYSVLRGRYLGMRKRRQITRYTLRTGDGRLGSESGFFQRKGRAWQVFPTRLPRRGRPSVQEPPFVGAGPGPLPQGRARLGPGAPGQAALRPCPEGGRAVLPATPLPALPLYVLASLFPLSCCQPGRQCRQSRSSCLPELGAHVTQAGLPGHSQRGGEVRWNISHVLLASRQGLSNISLCAADAVLVWHLKGMLRQDFTRSCHFTVRNRCELIAHGNVCLQEPLPLPSLGACSRATPGRSIMGTVSAAKNNATHKSLEAVAHSGVWRFKCRSIPMTALSGQE